jgi:mono/diheme cytochrome c family protein
MKKNYYLKLLVVLLAFSTGTSAAALSVEMFEIEGLISPASPKVLTTELEQQLNVVVVDLNLKNTHSGWPVLSVEFESGQLSRSDIERAIANIEDPAGHNYRVHTGPPIMNAKFTEEEVNAMAALGPALPNFSAITNPINSSAESIVRGQQLFDSNCTTCHGLSGAGNGPAAHGITTFPRQLWVWNNTGSSTDGYLYWFITNGRNEMPPWGVILSENQRWDLINYIKALKKPE